MNGLRIPAVMAVALCVALPCGVVLSTQLARSSFERVKLRDQTITVKGYAERPITSDQAKWSAHLVARKPQLPAAYAELERGRTLLLNRLKSRGFEGAAVWESPVAVEPLRARDQEGNATNVIEGYALRQTFAVASGDVAAVAAAAQGASELLRDGVEIAADSPAFLFTKLDETKLEMLREAAANARARAEALVAGSSSRLGGLRSASQGVFQITPPHTTEVSGDGMNDTTSVAKVVKAVVTQEYAID